MRRLLWLLFLLPSLASAQGFIRYHPPASIRNGILSSGSTGLLAETSAGITAARTIQNTDGCLLVGNGDGVSADPTINVDTNCVPTFSSGTGDPPATCTPPELYYETDTFELSLCSNTDTWEFIITMNAQTDDATVVGSGTGFALKVIPDCNSTNNRLNYDTATNAWSCATAALTLAGGGTDVSAAADDTVLNSNGSAWSAKAVPDCDDSSGNHLNYDTGTNAFTCGTSSSGSGSSIDLTTFSVTDEFCGGLTSTGNVGSLGWGITSLATGTIVMATDTNATHPCIVDFQDSGSDNSGHTLFLSLVHTTLLNTADWTYQCLMTTSSASATAFNCGLTVNGDPDGMTNAIIIRFDSDRSDTTFKYQICDADTAAGCDAAGDDTDSTVIDSGVTVVAGTYYLMKIRFDATGVGGTPTLYFSINGGSESTMCASGCTDILTGLPAADLRPRNTWITRDTNGARVGKLDFAAFTMSGLSRY